MIDVFSSEGIGAEGQAEIILRVLTTHWRPPGQLMSPLQQVDLNRLALAAIILGVFTLPAVSRALSLALLPFPLIITQ